MALVYGSEPSSSYSFFASHSRATTASTNDMASSQNPKSSQSTISSGPSSSPPIPIPAKKTQSKGAIPTPAHSHEKDPETPEVMHRRDGGGYMPPTPGDAVEDKARRGGRPAVVFERKEGILKELKSARNDQYRLERLTEDRLMRLRDSLDDDWALPFDIEEAAFNKWEQELQELSDVGGYEYDPTKKRLTIITIPGPIHERVVTVFSEWVFEVKKTFKQERRMFWTANERSKLTSRKRLTPDGSLSIEAGPPIVVLEVGVSQPFEAKEGRSSLLAKAKLWLLEGRATRLVILVDIEITIKGAESIPFASFNSSTTQSSSQSQHGLPYGILKTDLRTLTDEDLGSKILSWYKEKTMVEERELVTLQRVTVYLYKRKPPPDTNDITCTAKFEIFNREQGFTPPDLRDAVIDAHDMDIPSSSEKIALPIDNLIACFDLALKKKEIEVAEDRAITLRNEYQMGENTSEFAPSSGAGKSTDLEYHLPQTREKKRKLEVDSSFGSGVFVMDHQSSREESPQFSQRRSPEATEGVVGVSSGETVDSSSAAPNTLKKQVKGKKKRGRKR